MEKAGFKQIRLSFLLLGMVIAGALVIIPGSPRQPHFQGRPLTDWLDDLVAENVPHPIAVTHEMLVERRERAALAIREMGTNTLPLLVRFLSTDTSPSPARSALIRLLERQSLVNISLPPIPDRPQQAIEAFRVLGSLASRAIPKLAELFESGTNYWSVACLKAIGPDSIPALIQAINSTNQQVTRLAIETLGEFGTVSGKAVPLLAQIADGTNVGGAYTALRVLSEIDPNPSRFVPLFAAKLGDTNLAPAAAFALGRIGPEGTPPLLKALGHSKFSVRCAAISALAPEVRNATREHYPTNYSFLGAVGLYNSAQSHCASYEYEMREESGIAVPAVLSVFDHPDPAVRSRILELCAQHKAAGVSGLSHGLSDKCPEVRTRAAELLHDLGFQVEAGAIVRGPLREKELCLIFSGDEFSEGGATILDELQKHEAKASFFLRAHFRTNADLVLLTRRIVADGHFLGPHSEEHLPSTACSHANEALITRNELFTDLINGRNTIQGLGIPKHEIRYFLPTCEHHNQASADWAKCLGFTAVFFTPGTNPVADCTIEQDGCFASQMFFESIIAKERRDPNGLNGSLLLFHLGSGQGMREQFHRRFSELLDFLVQKGYRLVRVDEMLEKG